MNSQMAAQLPRPMPTNATTNTCGNSSGSRPMQGSRCNVCAQAKMARVEMQRQAALGRFCPERCQAVQP